MTLRRFVLITILLLSSLLGYAIWKKRSLSSSSTPPLILKEATELPASSLALPPNPPDYINHFFNISVSPSFPLIETVTYDPKVSWNQGKPAWLVDYARHHKTSRHFIARSLNGTPEYFKQEVKRGDRFNVLCTDLNIEFYLLIDQTSCRLWFFSLFKKLNTADEFNALLIKSYPIGLGKEDPTAESKYLTPCGKFHLGNRVATYTLKQHGTYQGKKILMATVFGTRWIPFDAQSIEYPTPIKGLGIHGLPWKADPTTNLLQEDLSSLEKHASDGCIRMRQSDVEELFAIIISRPSTIEIIKDSANYTLQWPLIPLQNLPSPVSE